MKSSAMLCSRYVIHCKREKSYSFFSFVSYSFFLQHWHNLRKHNGERYAYTSHSQAVLDCLRNRHEWARLVDRGPKVIALNSSKVCYSYLFAAFSVKDITMTICLFLQTLI